MKKNTLSFNVPSDIIEKTTSAVRDYFRTEFAEDHSPQAVKAALQTWLDRKVDVALEEMPEVLTSPASDESSEFARILREAMPATVENEVPVEHPVFNGGRVYSPARLASMMGYLSSKGIELYKTKLNKLLFYADLTAFYLTGQGISGSRYAHLPYGPVPDTYENVLMLAELSGKIRQTAMPRSGAGVRLIETGEDIEAATSDLSADDRCVLDWVVETYGSLNSSEITELSHQEMAYRNTKAGESIAYRYAEFLKTLPPKDLLSS